MSVKLESSDKKIVLVDQHVVKQMVTIQTMLESLGDIVSGETIPIFKVRLKLIFSSL